MKKRHNQHRKNKSIRTYIKEISPSDFDEPRFITKLNEFRKRHRNNTKSEEITMRALYLTDRGIYSFNVRNELLFYKLTTGEQSHPHFVMSRGNSKHKNAQYTFIMDSCEWIPVEKGTHLPSEHSIVFIKTKRFKNIVPSIHCDLVLEFLCDETNETIHDLYLTMPQNTQLSNKQYEEDLNQLVQLIE